MSQNFTAFPSLPYVGAPFGQPTNLHAPINAMDKQSKCVRLDIPWTFYGASPANQNIGVSVNLQIGGQQGVTAALDAIRSVYIDNSFSPVPVFIQFPDTLYTVICPAFAVVMSPVFTYVQQFTVYAQGFEIGQAPTTSVFCSNTRHDGFYVPTTQSGVDPALAVQYAFTDRYVTPYSGNFNIASVNFGPADATRYIAAVINQMYQSSVVTISALTIGGIAAVKKIGATKNLGGLNGDVTQSEIWMAQVPTGTSGSAVFVLTNTGGNPIVPLIDFYAIKNLSNPLYSQAKSAVSPSGVGASLSVTLDPKPNGLILGAYAGVVAGGTPAWINLSQDDYAAFNRLQAGAASFLTTDNTQRVVGNAYANTFVGLALA